MTKAFTSALGYGVTIRGYIDEDDRLVLLEPEGGGGGEYNAATVTIRPDPLTATAPLFTVQTVELNDDGIAGPGILAFESATIAFTTLTNAIVVFTDADGYEFTPVSGVEPVEAEAPAFVITGDAVITYKEV